MKNLRAARKVTVLIDNEGVPTPHVSHFEYFFATPFNEIEVTKFLTRLIKKRRMSVHSIQFGPTRNVTKGRVWSRRKIEEDIMEA